MKANGQVIFTRRPDGSVVHEWKGGRRVAVTAGLFTVMGIKPTGVVNLGGILFRVITIAAEEHAGRCYTTYIAMREGVLARFTKWRVDTTVVLATRLSRVDHWLYHGRRQSECPCEYFDWPKWSLAGLISRFM